MVWDESKHPRDSIGRFSSKRSEKSIYIPLNFFAEKGIEQQTPAQLRKGIRKLQELIKMHQYKINNPDKVWKDWDTFSEARKASEIRKWRREIVAFENSIRNREERLKKL